mgnify:CR=1 FL=1
MIDALLIIGGWIFVAYFLARKPKYYETFDPDDEEFHLK